MWILLPIGMGALLLLVTRERAVSVLGGLTAGALALQLDSAIWVEPGLAEKMVNGE